MKKIIAIFLGIMGVASALEFGYMGNKSFGMGGSGVALGSTDLSTYYNPALQGVDNDFKLSYSLGARFKEYKLAELSKINFSSIDDINTLNNILERNYLSATTENGVALQAPLKLKGSVSSSFGVGIFYTKMGVINFSGNINTGTTNIDNANNAYINTNTLDLLEVPLSFTMQIFSGFGDFHIGANLKYIYAGYGNSMEKISVNTKISDSFKNAINGANDATTHTFGVDVGLAYVAPKEYVTIGVVAKNLNNPTINTGLTTSTQKLKLDSQYRLGISTKIIPMTTLTLDFDLKPNEEFGGFNTDFARKKAQYISGGGIFEIGIFDLKLGFAKNILKGNSDGWLISGGLGIGYIDISMYSSTKLATINDLKLPTEFGVKLGGGFSF